MTDLNRAQIPEEAQQAAGAERRTVDMPLRQNDLRRAGSSRYADKNRKQAGATVTDIRVRLRAIREAAVKQQKMRSRAAQAAREDAERAYSEQEQKLQVITVHSRYQDKRESHALPRVEAARQIRVKDRKAVIIAAAAAIFLMGYIAAAAHFGSHFYPRTSAYGVDISWMTQEEAAAAVASRISAYRLTLRERGGEEEVIRASQIGLQYKEDGSFRTALDHQKGILWPFVLLFGRHHNVQAAHTYDSVRTGDVIAGLTCLSGDDIVDPEDARLGPSEDGYEIIPEVMGDRLDPAATGRAIRRALDEGSTSLNLELAGCYLEPEVYEDDVILRAQMEALNTLFGADLTIELGDQSRQVNADAVRGFISTKVDGSYFIDPEKVRAYIGELAQRTDTLGGYRTFRTTTGRTVELWGGDYGWEMDQAGTAQALLEAVRDKQQGPFEPYYTHTALCRDANDIGDTYVEVSITDQEMWVYQNGELMVDTPVVTGNPNKGNATPSGGVWEVDGTYRDEILVGEGYRQPVDYWIPFNEGVGIHDLKSRYYYGGTIYQYAGSHGCVNTPLEAVEQIFDIVYAGVPVIVYE